MAQLRPDYVSKLKLMVAATEALLLPPVLVEAEEAAATEDICPLISPLGFCLVCTLTYALPSFISLTKSDICLPFNGPSRFAKVKIPCDKNPFLQDQ